MIGGTSGLWFETPGQVIVVGGTVFFLYVDSVGGVMLGGSAERGPDITNLQSTGGAVVNGFVEISTARPGGFNYYIDARGGVVCNGSAQRGPDITNISTSGGAVVNGWVEISTHFIEEGGDNLTIYEVTECAQGVVCGGTADVTNESWQLLLYYQKCSEDEQFDWTAIYLPPGNYADSGDPYYDDHIRINQSYTCGNDGFNGLTFYTELIRKLVDVDGNVTQAFGLPDELEAIDLTLEFVDYPSGEEGDLPVIASDVGFLNFDIGHANTWVGDTLKVVTITATIEGVEYQWTAKHDLPQCPNIVLLEPYTSDAGQPCDGIMEYVTDATYDDPDTVISITFAMNECKGFGNATIDYAYLTVPSKNIFGLAALEMPNSISDSGQMNLTFTVPGIDLTGQSGLGIVYLFVSDPAPCVMSWPINLYIGIP